MIFDYRRFSGVVLDPEEAQLNEGGSNQWDNCGAADYALILRWLGNGDPFEPQQIMDSIHGVGYHGGELSRNLISFFNAHRDRYPHVPTITVEQGGDIVARARGAAAARYPMTNWWWCNSNGDIQVRNTGILHWSGIVYDTGTALGIWNIMRGTLVELTHAQARAAYAGEFTTFHQALGGEALTESEVWAVLRAVQLAVPTYPPNNAMIGKYAAQVTAGKPLDVAVQEMISNEPFFADYRRRITDSLNTIDTLKTEVAALKKGGAIPPGTQFTATTK